MKNANQFEYANSAFAAYLAAALERPGTSADAVARAMGLAHSQSLIAIAQGAYRLPIDKVPSLARALNVDPLALLVLAMRQYSIELSELLEAYCTAPLTG